MPHTITPTALAIDITDRIVFGEILDAQPYLSRLLRQAIYRAACDTIADQLTFGDPAALLAAPHVSRRC